VLRLLRITADFSRIISCLVRLSTYYVLRLLRITADFSRMAGYVSHQMSMLPGLDPALRSPVSPHRVSVRVAAKELKDEVDVYWIDYSGESLGNISVSCR